MEIYNIDFMSTIYFTALAWSDGGEFCLFVCLFDGV
jgi:hypothetical protein